MQRDRRLRQAMGHYKIRSIHGQLEHGQQCCLCNKGVLWLRRPRGEGVSGPTRLGRQQRVQTTTTSRKVLAICLGVGGGFLLVLCLFCVFCCRRRRAYLKDGKAHVDLDESNKCYEGDQGAGGTLPAVLGTAGAAEGHTPHVDANGFDSGEESI